MLNQRLATWILASNACLFVALIVMIVRAASSGPQPVLTVERLNIVDSTGKLALVLANADRLPGGTFGHKEYPKPFVGRGRSAGMVFLNEVGDEVGGLLFEGAPRDSAYAAFGHLSFDQWKQNQVVALQYADNGRTRLAGLRVWDRPTDAPLEEQFALAERMLQLPPGPQRDSLDQERLRVRARVAGVPRLFLGSVDRIAQLELRDPAGRVRARLFVDSVGAALQFLDESGALVSTYR